MYLWSLKRKFGGKFSKEELLLTYSQRNRQSEKNYREDAITSVAFFHLVNLISKEPNDLLTSFVITLVFTKIFIPASVAIILNHLHHAKFSNHPSVVVKCSTYFNITSTYFLFQRKLHQQAFASRHFHRNSVLEFSPPRPKVLLLYIENTFIIWSYRRDSLYTFFEYFNSKDIDIQFEMKVENNRSLLFRDVLVTCILFGYYCIS